MTLSMFIEQMLGRKLTESSYLHRVPLQDFISKISNKKKKSSEILKFKEKHNMMREEYHEFEQTLGHDGIATGVYADCTPFEHYDLKKAMDELKSYGYNPMCEDKMYDGMTGEELEGLIMNGPVFYQRLKHMSQNKIHSIGRSQKTSQTRQPQEGRKANGGFKVGLMERDVIGGHGCGHVIFDRLQEQSDDFFMWFCGVCGLPAVKDKENIYKQCNVCHSTILKRIRLPYGSKLLMQELAGMGIIARCVAHSNQKVEVIAPA